MNTRSWLSVLVPLSLALPAAAARAEEPAPSPETVAFRVDTLRDESALVPTLMRLANHLEDADGVRSVRVRLAAREVQVTFDAGATGVPSLVTAVESLGWRTGPSRVEARPVIALGGESG